MNNSEFRKLLQGDSDQTSREAGSREDGTADPGQSGRVLSKPTTLKDARDTSSDYAREFRQRNANLQPSKQFRSTKAPRGTKYRDGYTDRAKARAEAESDGVVDERVARIKALEEQMKLEQISEETFLALRDEITGGDAQATHLVKGLDRKLLERVRRGEDVMGLGGQDVADNKKEQMGDLDDELEKLGQRDVQAVKREDKEKRGSAAANPSLVAGVKRTRDQIMADLKAQRRAAAEAKAAAAPKLDGRFKRIDEAQKPKIEVDSKGRQVVTVVGKDGKVKKMVRKAATQTTHDDATDALSNEEKRSVLGADVEIPQIVTSNVKDDSDDDIFEGVGTDYNPLADMDGSSSDESDDESGDDSDKALRNSHSEQSLARSKPPLSEARRENPSTEMDIRKVSRAPRNYFNQKPAGAADEQTQSNHTLAIQEVLKKAARMDPLGSNDEENAADPTEIARRKKRAEMLSNHDRDMDDMDVGFGGTRFDEDDGGDNENIRLSQWKDGGEGGKWEKDEAGVGKKKRKPKKRKGDVDNVDDIMRVIEGRKQKAN